MQAHVTTRCGEAGHRELTIQLASPSPIPDLHRILIDYFEGAVGGGSTFEAGQTIRLGWSTLRICDRADGTLGVEERELTAAPRWTESVDRALHDIWQQREIVASVGLLARLSFPAQDEAVMVADCGMDADSMVLLRLPAKDLPEGFSGWTLACAGDHDHGERHLLPLLAVAAHQPGLVQLLALPHDTTVLVLYREKPNTSPGALRIEPHVFRDGGELAPAPGSYLAALQA